MSQSFGFFFYIFPRVPWNSSYEKPHSSSFEKVTELLIFAHLSNELVLFLVLSGDVEYRTNAGQNTFYFIFCCHSHLNQSIVKSRFLSSRERKKSS